MFKPKKEGRLSRGCPNGGAQPQEWSVAGSRGGNSQHFPTKTLFLRGPQVIV